MVFLFAAILGCTKEEVNNAPTANAGASVVITLPSNSVTLAGSGADADGQIVNYMWSQIAGPAATTVVNPGSPTTSVHGFVQGDYVFRLTVTDNEGAVGADTVSVKVNPAPRNSAPTANAGANQTITLPTNNITLTGAGADADGQVVTYQWTQLAGPSFTTIASTGSATTTVTGFIQGDYLFQLLVADNLDATGMDTVMIKVNPVPGNIIPVANAGSSVVIALPANSVTLSGSGSDADGQVVAYQWSQVSGPGSSLIVNPGSAATVVNGLVQGDYIFQLLVTDNAGATGTDTMKVKVTPELTTAQTVTFQPANNPNEKMLVYQGGQDRSFLGGNEWVIDAWTVGGETYIGRKAFKFDLSAIPAGATIVSANLYLYSNTPPENGNLVDANYGYNNGMILQQITSNWSPATANWFNQPATTTANQVLIPHTSQSVLDLNIDVKNLVSAMVGGTNYGFLLKLQEETPYISRQFVSSHNVAKPQKHPKLVITYR
jgi:hypothetical protein